MWGKAGDHSLRRSAFQEAISHLGKAIAMADRAGGAKAGDSGERARLHADYANALIPARGYGAPETTEAFAKARESSAGDKDAPARLAADYGLWVGSIARFELSAARAYGLRSLVTSARDPIRPRSASPTVSWARPTGSPESIAKRESIWNARWPCSSLVATTIWPFASGKTPVSRRW